MFFYSYNIIIYLNKYAERPKPKLTTILMVILFLWFVAQCFANAYLGQTFFYESLTGGIYGISYSLILIQLDSSIHSIAEKSGFILHLSRRYKFYLFFASIAMFTVTIVYYNSELLSWRVEQQWVVNASKPCNIDQWGLDYRIGIDYTFLDTSALFLLMGAGFGASYATNTIENLSWSETVIWKRILRGLIGVATMFIVFFIFWQIP